jgi:hypothetical protein
VEKYVPDRQATDNNKIWRMRVLCLISESTNTHPEYAILIAFPLQQWLHERASLLRYMYVHCQDFYILAVALYTLEIRLSIDGRWAGNNYGRDVIS